MKSIGKYLKSVRSSKKIKLSDLQKETKIKKDFIKAIEKESWSRLPDYAVVVGFVKGIAGVLGLDKRQVVALLRRDYPPQKLDVNPKPDVSSTLRWSPRVTFILGIIFASIAILGYLGFQYANFIQPPTLEVIKPKNDERVSESTLLVEGLTDPEATVRINNQPVLVSEEGEFSTEIEIFEGTREIVVKTVSRSGKETVVIRSIIPELD